LVIGQNHRARLNVFPRQQEQEDGTPSIGGRRTDMKAFVSALALGLVLAFSAPASAGVGNAYVGDQITGPAPKAAPKAAENRAMKREARREAREARRAARRDARQT
jgi:hypothetical protein